MHILTLSWVFRDECCWKDLARSIPVINKIHFVNLAFKIRKKLLTFLENFPEVSTPKKD
jgi:hypothetical protein